MSSENFHCSPGNAIRMTATTIVTNEKGCLEISARGFDSSISCDSTDIFANVADSHSYSCKIIFVHSVRLNEQKARDLFLSFT